MTRPPGSSSSADPQRVEPERVAGELRQHDDGAEQRQHRGRQQRDREREVARRERAQVEQRGVGALQPDLAPDEHRQQRQRRSRSGSTARPARCRSAAVPILLSPYTSDENASADRITDSTSSGTLRVSEMLGTQRRPMSSMATRDREHHPEQSLPGQDLQQRARDDGADRGATDITIEMRPMMRPRSVGATIVITVVIISGIMIAVPMAWTTRPTMSISNTGESARSACRR